MRRYGAKRDDNEAAIVRFLEANGCIVQRLSAPGVPDLLVSRGGVNCLLEVKDPTKPPSKRRLTPDQARWIERWRGQVAIVETPQDAMRVVWLQSADSEVPF
jgi:Holliday junction resolvase